MNIQSVLKYAVNLIPKGLRTKIYSLPYIGYRLKARIGKLFYTEQRQYFEFISKARKGLEMKLKLPEENEFYLETHDPYVTNFLCNYIKPGWVFLDIGAHIGYFTLLVSRLVGPKGKVYAIEPSRTNLARLEEHLMHNNCQTNTAVLQIAIWDSDGKHEFLESEVSTISRLRDSGLEGFRSLNKSYMVQSRSLDSLVKDGTILKPNFIKIDVEGAELNALRGMDKILGEVKPPLILEIHSAKIALDVNDFLKKKNYIVYSIDTSNSIPINEKKLIEIVKNAQSGMNFLYV